MKLADALLVRADANRKLGSLTERIKANCRVQAGEDPVEDPQPLIAESFRILQEQEILACRMNRTNVSFKLRSGKTMMECLAERDRLTAQHKLLKDAAESCRLEPNRYSSSEIVWKAALKVNSLERQADDLSKEIRELNSAIQEANWNTELLD